MTTSNKITTCPIWGEKYKAKGVYDPETRKYLVQDSARTFAGYNVSYFLLNVYIKWYSDRQKAWLTTWIVDQWGQGNHQPEITHEVLSTITPKRALPVYKRADRLLKYIALAASIEGVGHALRWSPDQYELLAWSESIDWSEVEYFLDFLERRGWVESGVPGAGIYGESWKVTVEGHTRVGEVENQERASDSSQAFVAMWINDRTEAAFEKGLRPGIEDAGYEALRIDKKEDVVKIDDEIMSEIRASRFLVTDFTHGDGGARGGVYFEAGFAQGLGLPVIYTCHRDMVEYLHFDTRQYAHILWDEPEVLRVDIRNRIRARIGNGPRGNTMIGSGSATPK